MRRSVWRRKQRDPMFKVIQSLRGRVRSAILANPKSRKIDRFCGLIGCGKFELRCHIERQFKPGMTWENHGAWHIDHIRPCCSFDLSIPEQQYACFHFSNLQPLWAAENLQKSGKWRNRRQHHSHHAS